jgi:hypothetical protein
MAYNKQHWHTTNSIYVSKAIMDSRTKMDYNGMYNWSYYNPEEFKDSYYVMNIFCTFCSRFSYFLYPLVIKTFLGFNKFHIEGLHGVKVNRHSVVEPFPPHPKCTQMLECFGGPWTRKWTAQAAPSVSMHSSKLFPDSEARADSHSPQRRRHKISPFRKVHKRSSANFTTTPIINPECTSDFKLRLRLRCNHDWPSR